MADARRPLQAADLLDADCPLHGPFLKWCVARVEKQSARCGAVVRGDRTNTQADASEPTKRKARKFLAEYPQFREVVVPLDGKGNPILKEAA